MANTCRAIFKTARFQSIEVVDATSAAAATFQVGDLVTYNPSTKAIAAVAAGTTTVPANAAIIALSDIGLKEPGNKSRSGVYAHVDVESKNLQADKGVYFTAGQTKKVGLFFVTDAKDVVLSDGDGATEYLR